MNRVTKCLALASTLAVVASGPAGGAPRTRTETAPYERASGIQLMDVATVEVASGDLPEAQPLRGERWVSVAVADASGRPVAAIVHQGEAVLGDLCGESEQPLALVNREPVHVHVYTGPGCADLSVPTQGTVTFTFAK